MARIGKGHRLHLPKEVVSALNLKEGQKVLLIVEGNSLVLRSIEDPIELALSSRKFASITPEAAEQIVTDHQRGAIKNHVRDT